jgi:hypothetical protein
MYCLSSAKKSGTQALRGRVRIFLQKEKASERHNGSAFRLADGGVMTISDVGMTGFDRDIF